jgi:MYXO-CTERM domain-containing protein
MPTAAKPEPVEWVASEAGGALLGLLAIGAGRRRAVYAVCALPCDDGRGFALAKVEGGTDDEASGYAVRVTRGGRPLSCECKSWLVRDYCKHTREIGKLVSEGKL